MYIENIYLENFGHFEKEKFKFIYPGVNVIIANNGKGKSTLLDALSVVLGSWLLGIKGVDSRHIRDYEVRRDSFNFSDEKYPVIIKAEVEVRGKKYKIKRDKLSSNQKTRYIEAKDIKELAEQTYLDNKYHLPLLSYYGTGRRWLEPKESKEKEYLITERIDGYKYSIDPRVNIKFFTEWFKKNSNHPNVEVIKSALTSCLENCVNLYYDKNIETLMIEFINEKRIPFTHLSDGQKTLLAMIADIAFKIITLNPNYKGNDALKKTTGCVLIDEIDLHLHPKWQREVLDNLTKTFEKLQFIVTTHSPFIIQSIEDGNLIRLDEEEMKDFNNLSIEEISEDLMNVELPQRSKKFTSMMNVATEYYELLDERNEEILTEKNNDITKKVADYEKTLTNLLIPYSQNPAYAAYLAFIKSQKILKDIEIGILK